MANLEQKSQVGPKTRQNFNKKDKVECKMCKLGSKISKFRPKIDKFGRNMEFLLRFFVFRGIQLNMRGNTT